MSPRAILIGCILGSLMVWAAILVPPLTLAATPADEGIAVHDHLERILRVDIPDRPVVVGDPHLMAAVCAGNDYNPVTASGGCGGLAWPDRIEIDADIVRGLDVQWRPALMAVIHEHLHRPGDETMLDEGVVDALASDLCPAIAWSLWGLRGPCGWEGYPAQASGVRLASARATDSPSRSRAAHQFRRQLWHADNQEREALYQEEIA